jgi:hypothetical protein
LGYPIFGIIRFAWRLACAHNLRKFQESVAERKGWDHQKLLGKCFAMAVSAFTSSTSNEMKNSFS